MLKEIIRQNLTEAKAILRTAMKQLPPDDLKRHGDLRDMIDRLDQLLEDK